LSAFTVLRKNKLKCPLYLIKWRAENKSVVPDLRKADLRGAQLQSANLSDADLSDADLSDANLRQAVLIRAFRPNADLHRSADLHDANLKERPMASALSSQKCAFGEIVELARKLRTIAFSVCGIARTLAPVMFFCNCCGAHSDQARWEKYHAPVNDGFCDAVSHIHGPDVRSADWDGFNQSSDWDRYNLGDWDRYNLGDWDQYTLGTAGNHEINPGRGSRPL
jgi:Pentapeptide repeats (8 copies)